MRFNIAASLAGTEAGLCELGRLRSLLEGQVVTSVGYEFCEGNEASNEWNRRDLSAHVIDMGIAIALSGGYALYFTWENGTWGEGIAVSYGPPGEVSANLDVTSVDVSSDPFWSTLIGGKIRLLSVAWSKDEYGEAPAIPVGFKLGIGETLVVVTLGTTKGDSLAYAPEELVAIFNADPSKGYLASREFVDL